MNDRMHIPFGKPWITDEDRQAVWNVLTGDILAHGPQCKNFETAFASFMGGDNHAATVSSGMAALHLSWLLLGVGPQDEVIVPAQTHIATVHAVELTGAKPVFVDCEAATGNLSAAQIEKAITPRTKGIALVHFLGIPCEMDAIVALAEKHQLKIVEDCALGVGARWDGKHVGLFGDCGCFSFYPAKHITTAEGGMWVTRDADLAEKAKKFKAFGVDRNFLERTIPGMYDVPTLGLNYRMSDLNAVLGVQQMKKLPEILRKRAENFRILKEELSRAGEKVTLLDSTTSRAANSHYCLSAILRGDLAAHRNDIISKLNSAGIGTSVYYPQPTVRMTYYRNKYGYDASQYPHAEAISDHSIALPVGPHIAPDQAACIGKKFVEIINQGSHEHGN